MLKIHIKEPIWNGRRVGIAANIEQDIEVTIGHSAYPNKYRMTWGKLRTYPINRSFSRGVAVRTPPIMDFDEVVNGVVKDSIKKEPKVKECW